MHQHLKARCIRKSRLLCRTSFPTDLVLCSWSQQQNASLVTLDTRAAIARLRLCHLRMKPRARDVKQWLAMRTPRLARSTWICQACQASAPRKRTFASMRRRVSFDSPAIRCQASHMRMARLRSFFALWCLRIALARRLLLASVRHARIHSRRRLVRTHRHRTCSPRRRNAPRAARCLHASRAESTMRNSCAVLRRNWAASTVSRALCIAFHFRTNSAKARVMRTCSRYCSQKIWTALRACPASVRWRQRSREALAVPAVTTQRGSERSGDRMRSFTLSLSPLDASTCRQWRNAQRCERHTRRATTRASAAQSVSGVGRLIPVGSAAGSAPGSAAGSTMPQPPSESTEQS
mmetsp:Transcript_127683/g.225007  ORF Transcript_127683/g.225007 Transcript_127683/m.225007 type:complete len:350 (-) Transcript_127683:264-1313(-)